jgi:hypothetical protein
VEQLEHASNAELLSKLAGKAAADALMQQYGGLTNLAKASFDELQLVKGIGQSKAAAIKSAFLLAKRLTREVYPESPLMDEPGHIADFLREENRPYTVEHWAGLEREHGVHDVLPCALRHCRVGMLQIDLGDLQVHGRLPGCLVLGAKEGEGFVFVFGAQTLLFAGRRFLGIENARPPKQDESWFHN